MPDYAADVQDFSPFGVLSSMGEGSPYGEVMLNGGATCTSAGSMTTASGAVYMPVLVRVPTPVYALAWLNGGTVSGNCDAGIYDRNQNRLVSLGSTAQTGASAVQATSITSLTLAPGLYYLAIAADNTTGLYRASALGGALGRVTGCAIQASAFPLPATASFAAQTGVPTLPLVCAAIGTVF